MSDDADDGTGHGQSAKQRPGAEPLVLRVTIGPRAERAIRGRAPEILADGGPGQKGEQDGEQIASFHAISVEQVRRARKPVAQALPAAMLCSLRTARNTDSSLWTAPTFASGIHWAAWISLPARRSRDAARKR